MPNSTAGKYAILGKLIPPNETPPTQGGVTPPRFLKETPKANKGNIKIIVVINPGMKRPEFRLYLRCLLILAYAKCTWENNNKRNRALNQEV